MEIGAWPKFPSTEIFLSFEMPTPISPIPDLEKINDDPIQETAKVPKIILYFMWDHSLKTLHFLRGEGSNIGQICRPIVVLLYYYTIV